MPPTWRRSESCLFLCSFRVCARSSMRTYPSRPPSFCVQPAGSATPSTTKGSRARTMPRVAAACQADARVLFTLDLDFADIRAYPPSEYVGIVVLRPTEPSRRQALALLTRVLPVLSAEWIEHRLWIVEPARLRVRGPHEPAV